MKPIPEGVRRICIVVGGLFVAGWLVYAFIETRGFKYMNGDAWLITAVGSIVAFFVPSVIYRTARWIKEGFAIDAQP